MQLKNLQANLFVSQNLTTKENRFLFEGSVETQETTDKGFDSWKYADREKADALKKEFPEIKTATDQQIEDTATAIINNKDNRMHFRFNGIDEAWENKDCRKAIVDHVLGKKLEFRRKILQYREQSNQFRQERRSPLDEKKLEKLELALSTEKEREEKYSQIIFGKIEEFDVVGGEKAKKELADFVAQTIVMNEREYDILSSEEIEAIASGVWGKLYSAEENDTSPWEKWINSEVSKKELSKIKKISVPQILSTTMAIVGGRTEKSSRNHQENMPKP